MAKVQTKDIAHLIAKKKNIDEADAEAYVESFFSLVNDGLVSDRIVKVKGLGTFKLVDVRERESIDVNTGGRVKIGGHSKVTFQPDTTLKELVNKPFSQFETVVLNEGVDEKELASVEYVEDASQEPSSSESKSDEDGEMMKEIPADLENVGDGNTQYAAEAPVELTKDADNGSSSDSYSNSVSRESQGQDAARTEEKNGVSGLNNDKDSFETLDNVVINTSMDTDDDTGEETSAAKTDTMPVKEPYHLSADEMGKTDDTTREPSVEDIAGEAELDEEDAKNTEKNKKSMFRIIILCSAAIFFILAVFFCGYYLGGRESADENDTPRPEAKKVVAATEKVAVSKATKPVAADSVKANIIKKDTVSTSNELEQDSGKGNMKTKDNTSEKKTPEALSTAERMVRTGAYVIVGTEKKVTVKKGQTMKSIARLYLGEGMECYIQLHNGRMEVSEGETINIPKVELKKKATNKKVS